MKQIYVHGLGQTPAAWKETLSGIRDGDGIVCPDLAELSRGKEISYQNLYRAFSQLCDKTEGALCLCGLSLGAVLCLNYAIDHPKKVHSLALIAVQYKMPKRLLQFQNMLFRIMPGSAFGQMGFQKKELIRLCGSMAELDFGGSIRKVACPVLLLCGEKDVSNKKASMELAEKLPNAEFAEIEGAGHEVNLEAPKKLAEKLAVFFFDCN